MIATRIRRSLRVFGFMAVVLGGGLRAEGEELRAKS
jgi:hypothetical protein